MSSKGLTEKKIIEGTFSFIDGTNKVQQAKAERRERQ